MYAVSARKPEHCVMNWEGNVRKLKSVVSDAGVVNYLLPGRDVLDEMPSLDINGLIGKMLHVQFDGAIHCVVSGKRIKKTYGEGMSYEAFLNSPLACPSIIRPELSRIHEGIALRDEAWEKAHHLQPHVVYISQTSHLKVGVTRATNVPSRWVDQGACGAIVVANAPYRQLAGEMEVALKHAFSDRTNWRNMLRETRLDESSLVEAKEDALHELGDRYATFFEEADEVTSLHFPVLQYPPKVKSVKLDKHPVLEGRLIGIKGQYWMFEDGRVWNVRSHSGYRISLNVS